MASAEKGSSRSAGRSKGGSKTSGARTSSRKPSGPKTLHSSARKQTSAVARGGAGQKAAKKTSGTATGKTAAKPTRKASPLKAVKKAVRSVTKKVASVLTPAKKSRTTTPGSPAPRKASPATSARSRPVRRASDVDPSKLDDVSGQTSSKGPFDSKRSDAARQRDIDSAFTNRNDEWADEDHLTNRSGDKRIGTKNRKYE